MKTESEMEDSVKESSGEMVGGPSAYLRYIPNVFGSVQKRGPVSEDGVSELEYGGPESSSSSSCSKSLAVTETERIGGFGLVGNSSRYRCGKRIRLLGWPDGLGGGKGDPKA